MRSLQDLLFIVKISVMGNIVTYACFLLLLYMFNMLTDLKISLTIIILKLRKHYIARGYTFVDQSRSTYIFIGYRSSTEIVEDTFLNKIIGLFCTSRQTTKPRELAP